ncbi:hypothetical protein, partial [Sphaerobacter sp.]|uniref:hypothetical protein n=1 Tax=Sphaerobacter sp. TaxID=2099654 RepID=UPI0025D3C85B
RAAEPNAVGWTLLYHSPLRRAVLVSLGVTSRARAERQDLYGTRPSLTSFTLRTARMVGP